MKKKLINNQFIRIIMIFICLLVFLFRIIEGPDTRAEWSYTVFILLFSLGLIVDFYLISRKNNNKSSGDMHNKN